MVGLELPEGIIDGAGDDVGLTDGALDSDGD